MPCPNTEKCLPSVLCSFKIYFVKGIIRDNGEMLLSLDVTEDSVFHCMRRINPWGVYHSVSSGFPEQEAFLVVVPKTHVSSCT